jgi:hypothetical protein
MALFHLDHFAKATCHGLSEVVIAIRENANVQAGVPR